MEDGPTLTHGGMSYGAATLAIRQEGGEAALAAERTVYEVKQMRPLIAIALLGSAACQPAAAPPEIGTMDVDYIHLTTEFPSYGPGAEVTLRLSNPTQRAYGYNLCHSRLERLEGDRWIEVRPMLAEACTMELRLIQPAGRDTYTFRLDPTTAGGQYRVQTSVEEMEAGERLALASNTFAVTPRGADRP